jgi:hypothetical protein
VTYLKKARAFLVSAVIAAIALRIVWWSVEPLIPYIIIGILLCTVIAMALFRTTRL